MASSNFQEYHIPGLGLGSDSLSPSVDPSKLSHYQILGVHQGATEEEITKAYRKRALELHPDKTGTHLSEEWMKKLNDAKSVLLSEKREDYDGKLADEGQAVVDPAGFLPDGHRLSLQFLQLFKSSKVTFEAGLIRQNLHHLQDILKKEINKDPKDLPALPFTAAPARRATASPKEPSKLLSQQSPLSVVFEEMDSRLNAPELCLHVEAECEQLNNVLRMSKTQGKRTTLPEVDGEVAIMNLSNVPDRVLALFSSLFSESSGGNRSAILDTLASIVPYAAVEPASAEHGTQTNCTSCTKKFTTFRKAKHTCYQCRMQFCKDCSLQQVLSPRLQPTSSETVCSTCLDRITEKDVEDWTKASLQFITAGTVKSTKAAMGCLKVALCFSDSTIRPIIRVARSLFRSGLPELAMSLVTIAQKHSQDSREKLGAYILSAEIFRSMADENKDDPEIRWHHLLAAKDSINLALEQESCLDSGCVEIPNYDTVKRDVNESLYSLHEQQEKIQDDEVKQLCLEMESLWESRDCEELLEIVLDEDSVVSTSFLPHKENMTVAALERFLKPKCGFLDHMLSQDKSALLFFRGILKILKNQPLAGLIDIEEAAFSGHYHDWMREAIVDVVTSLLTKDPSLLLPHHSLQRALKGTYLLGSKLPDDRCNLLFSKLHETTLPFDRNWPDLTVTGLKLKGHSKFEKAVVSQVQEGKWDAKEAAMAYIDYVPACNHPVEVAFCFLYASMWLLKHLQVVVESSSPSEVYATKELIVTCLYTLLSLVYRHLHPGMQLYLSRLSLGTAMQAMKLTECFTTKRDVELITNLMEVVISKCRFCPVWHFPSVPLSEAVLLNIKSSRLHQDYMLTLQDMDENKLPMKKSELLYQLYENNLQYVCQLKDPEEARARAMQEMLREKGWSWNDVATLMTSPLSPRDSDGWLVQKPFLGVPMDFAELKGFSFNLDADNPSIEIIAVPANNSRGRVGLFSMQDVQTVLQLDASDLYPIFFSLDSPDEHQRFHPFQQFRYGTEKLQKTPLLHTLFETDYLLKSFSVGSEVSAKPPFNQRPCKAGLTKNLPPHLQEAVKPVAERGQTLSNINRFWIQAEELVYDQQQDGSKLTFRLSDLKMKIRSHPLLPGPDGKLQDTDHETDPDSPEAKFAADLTAHYNELGLHFPMFARLRELAKLQLLGLILRSVLDDMKDKAAGNGIEIPRQVLTDIQRDTYQHYQTKVNEMLRNLDREVGVWPAADSRSEISSLTRKMINELPYHVRSQASYSDVEPYAIKALRTKDDSVLSQVVDALMQLCEHRVSRSTLQSSVRRWLSIRSTSATSDLKTLICKHIPLPTREEIKRQIVSYHSQKYSSFKRKVDSITPSPSRLDRNPCKWVPAALFNEEEFDSIRLCYGGVLIAPKIRSGHVPQIPLHARSVPIRQSGPSLTNRPSSSTFRASTSSSVRVDEGHSYRGSYREGVSTRISTTRPARTPSSATSNPVLITFRSNLLSGQRVSESGGGVPSAAGGGRKGGGGGGRRGGGGKSGGGGRGGSGWGSKGAALFAGAALVAKSSQGDGNKRMTDQRRQQANQQRYFWNDPSTNTISAPNGQPVHTVSREQWNDKTPNVVYGIYSAKTGKLIYVGKTEQALKDRINGHVNDIKKARKNTKLVEFFNSGDHSVDDLRVTVLSVVKPGENIRRIEMDNVIKYDTKNSGANMRNPMNLKSYYAGTHQ